MSRETIVVRPHSADHRARARLPYAYRPDALCPRWTKFWEEVFEGDDDAAQKTAFIQEFVGVCMLGLATRYERIAVFVGMKGANGKSVALRVITGLFLAENVSVVHPHRMSQQYDRAKLRDALINIVSELPARELMETEALKAISSGDAIDARLPAHPPFSFCPRAGHLYACNELPPISDASGGPWRRLIPIEFNRTFEGDPSKDPRLAATILATELEGVAAWAIRGAARLLAQGGYTLPPSAQRRVAAWREDSDVVMQWALDRLAITEDRRIDVVPLPEGYTGHSLRNYYPLRTSELYEDYRKWSKEAGHTGQLSRKRFSQRLSSLGPARHEFSDATRWNVQFRPLPLE